MRKHKYLFLVIGLLIITGLACEQAGEILTPEEATARAQEGSFQPSGNGETAAGANFNPGDSAEVVGTGFLVNLLDAPGGRITGSQARGSTIEILESAEFEGEIWYHVDSETGQGWLRAENLAVAEEESTAEGEGEGEEEESASRFSSGDTAYLISNGFLINMLKEPNGTIQAVQERGAAVTILDVFQTDEGQTWYLIDAPTGEGWVPEENLNEEAP